MYQCKLCNHKASHPAFLRCARCFNTRQEVRGQSRSFAPSQTPQDDYTPAYLASMQYSALSQSQSDNAPFTGGGGTFDGGGASGSWGGSSSSSSCSSDSGSSSSSSSDSGSSSSCSTD